MISERIVLVCWLSAVASFVPPKADCSELSSASPASGQGSSSNLLKNGLVGWQQIGGKLVRLWRIEDGILYTKGGLVSAKRQAGARHGGWLATNREYGDFVLELEFKSVFDGSPSAVPPSGNSGVFIRAPLEGDPAYMGMKIQISFDPPDRPEQFTGSIYGPPLADRSGLLGPAAAGTSGRKW